MVMANDEDDHLRYLKEEAIAMDQALEGAVSEGLVELYPVLDPSPRTIAHKMDLFGERVAIFHFAGHANSKSLYLADGKFLAEGIASLVGAADLVVLNGCSTFGLVEFLWEAGVQSVIATSVQVKDRTAMQFSERFYKELGKGQTVEDAFASAKTFLAGGGTRFKGTPQLYRDIFPRKEEKTNPGAIPWGLYVKDESSVQWKIPSLPPRFFEGTPIQQYVESGQVNQALVLPVAVAFSEFGQEFLEEVRAVKDLASRNGQVRKFRKLKELIVRHLPSPVGVQMQSLFSTDTRLMTPSRERMGHLIHTYVRFCLLNLYGLISAVWDGSGGDQQIPKDIRREISDFLTLSTDDLERFELRNLMRLLLTFLSERALPYVQSEFKGLFGQKKRWEKVDSAMKRFRIRRLDFGLNQKTWPSESEVTTAEEDLSLILCSLGFWVNYKFVSVQGIGVVKTRLDEPYFSHQFQLRQGALHHENLEEQLSYPAFTHNDSVLIVPGEEMMEDEQTPKFLSLSPFFIDERNAAPGGILMYAGRSKEGEYLYALMDRDLSDLASGLGQLPFNWGRYKKEWEYLNSFLKDEEEDDG